MHCHNQVAFSRANVPSPAYYGHEHLIESFYSNSFLLNKSVAQSPNILNCIIHIHQQHLSCLRCPRHVSKTFFDPKTQLKAQPPPARWSCTAAAASDSSVAWSRPWWHSSRPLGSDSNDDMNGPLFGVIVWCRNSLTSAVLLVKPSIFFNHQASARETSCADSLGPPVLHLIESDFTERSVHSERIQKDGCCAWNRLNLFVFDIFISHPKNKEPRPNRIKLFWNASTNIPKTLWFDYDQPSSKIQLSTGQAAHTTLQNLQGFGGTILRIEPWDQKRPEALAEPPSHNGCDVHGANVSGTVYAQYIWQRLEISDFWQHWAHWCRPNCRKKTCTKWFWCFWETEMWKTSNQDLRAWWLKSWESPKLQLVFLFNVPLNPHKATGKWLAVNTNKRLTNWHSQKWLITYISDCLVHSDTAKAAVPLSAGLWSHRLGQIGCFPQLTWPRECASELSTARDKWIIGMYNNAICRHCDPCLKPSHRRLQIKSESKQLQDFLHGFPNWLNKKSNRRFNQHTRIGSQIPTLNIITNQDRQTTFLNQPKSQFNETELEKLTGGGFQIKDVLQNLYTKTKLLFTAFKVKVQLLSPVQRQSFRKRDVAQLFSQLKSWDLMGQINGCGLMDRGFRNLQVETSKSPKTSNPQLMMSPSSITHRLKLWRTMIIGGHRASICNIIPAANPLFQHSVTSVHGKMGRYPKYINQQFNRLC